MDTESLKVCMRNSPNQEWLSYVYNFEIYLGILIILNNYNCGFPPEVIRAFIQQENYLDYERII